MIPQRMTRTATRCFAPVAPLPLLESLWTEDVTAVGSYHLLLAHDVMKDSKSENDYRNFFGRVRKQYEGDMTIIMDNSLVELGSAVDMKMAIDAALALSADCVVAPDVMGDGKATIDAFDTFVTTAAWHRCKEAGLGIMAVPQGPDLQTYVRCLELYADYPEVTWVGIPRIAGRPDHLGGRRDLCAIAHAINPSWDMHLLGFSDNVIDDILSVRCGEYPARGIDSAVPVRAGIAGHTFRASRSDYGPRGNYWETTEHNQLTIDNIVEIRCLVGEWEDM